MPKTPLALCGNSTAVVEIAGPCDLHSEGHDPVAAQSKKLAELRTVSSPIDVENPDCLSFQVIRFDVLGKRRFTEQEANHVRLCPKCKAFHDMATAFTNVFDPSQ